MLLLFRPTEGGELLTTKRDQWSYVVVRKSSPFFIRRHYCENVGSNETRLNLHFSISPSSFFLNTGSNFSAIYKVPGKRFEREEFFFKRRNH